MIRCMMAVLVLVLGTAVAGVAGAAEGLATPDSGASSAVIAKYAWMWAGKAEMSRPWRVVPVAACTAECCCQVFEGGSMTYKCTSHEVCINDGGLCRSKTDAKCN